jgi:FK506-binding nuclear protein
LKKHQVDSTDDDDSPVMKPAVKHNARAIFDSGSDEDNVPISVALSKKDSAKVAVKHDAPSIFDSCSDEEDNDVTLSKKDSTKVSEETNLQNGQTNDGTKKNSDDRKRKSSAISEDPASSMYLLVPTYACVYFYYLLPTDL